MKTSSFPQMCLAPMAGFTDAAMRSIAVEHGAPICHTEMISSQGLVYGNRKTEELLRRLPNEGTYIVQIFGKNPDVMARAAEIVQDRTGAALAGIDINMGCPAPKINRNGEGCVLMGNPRLAADIVRAVKSAAGVPVSVKFRSGLDKKHVNAAEFALLLEDAGADRLTIHPRTRVQQYGGAADWDVLREAASAVSIPVTGSGDVVDGGSALRMLAETGCRSVMIGRAAVGNPHIFQEVQAALDAVPYTAPTNAERLSVLLDHLDLALKEKGVPRAILEMRAHIPKYLKGMRGACEMRVKLFSLTDPDDIRRTVEAYGNLI